MIATNNLINMSEFQKIIFVNNIDEDTLPVNVNMQMLSNEYPFVVFFTKQSSENNVNNIWHQGVRYTRFIGVDKNASKISIGDHELELVFNYETGKLGIYDTNELTLLTFKEIRYRNLQNEIVVYSKFDSNYVIDAIDNKFSILFNYETVSNGNIHKVSKTLNIFNSQGTNNTLTQNFIKVDEEEISTNNTISQDYRFTYEVYKDTYVNTSINKSYIIKSIYATDVFVELNNLNLRVNPTGFDVYKDNAVLNTNVKINAIHDNRYTFEIYVYPNNDRTVSSSLSRNIFIRTTSSNPSYVNVRTESATVTNGRAAVTIDIQKINTVNTSIDTDITFSLMYKNVNESEHVYSNQTKTYKINIKSDESNDFIYYGFKNPDNLSDNDMIYFDSTSLLDNDQFIYNDNKLTTKTLYDWYDSSMKSLMPGLYNSNNSTFYILVPTKYSSIIKPCFDMWEIDNYGNKIYIDASKDFNILTKTKTVGTCGEFIIYEYIYGVFKGKIKYNN